MTNRRAQTVLGLVMGVVLLATIVCALINPIAWVVGMVILCPLCHLWGKAHGRSHLRAHERFRIRS